MVSFSTFLTSITLAKRNPDPALLGAKLGIESQWLEPAEYLKEGKFSYIIVLIW